MLGFFLSLLSERYQKAAEEATAEKKRSVSICFLGNKQEPAIRTYPNAAVTVDFWNIKVAAMCPTESLA